MSSCMATTSAPMRFKTAAVFSKSAPAGLPNPHSTLKVATRSGAAHAVAAIASAILPKKAVRTVWVCRGGEMEWN